jgi:parvulin-like peptidyl-prolyl isomerase
MSVRTLSALATAAALCLVAVPAAAQPEVDVDGVAADEIDGVLVDRVVAVVNNAIILQSELYTRAAPMVADLDQIPEERERNRRTKQMIRQILDDMVNEELIVQAALEAKLEVEQKEITAALDEIKKQNKLDDAGLAQALALQGYTIASYKVDVKRQILRMRAINMLVRPKVTITDEDVRARYDAMNRRSAAVNAVRLNHILIALPEKPTEAQVAAAKEKASIVIQRTKAGEDFAKLAAEFSDDQATKNSGGDFGWIERGSIPTEWEVIVFGMEKSEVRGPISGPNGLHVFYVADVKQEDMSTFDELKEQIRNELYRREMDKQTKTWLDDLNKKAHVELKL